MHSNVNEKKKTFLRPFQIVKFRHIIQSVTGPHRQNDRDDRLCRKDHFFVKEHVLANMSFMSYAQVKVFALKGRNWIQTIVHISFYWKRHVFTIHFQTVGPVSHCMFDIVAATIGQQGLATGPPRPIHCCCCPQREISRGVKSGATYC